MALLDLLEARGGRQTHELMKALADPDPENLQGYVTRQRLNAYVDIARKFTRRFENADVRAVRDLDEERRRKERKERFTGPIFCYWLVYDPTGLLFKGMDAIERVLSHVNGGVELMNVISAYSLSGNEAEAYAIQNSFFTRIAAAGRSLREEIERRLPGAVAQARINARPPTYEQRDVVMTDAPPVSGFDADSIWK